MREKKTDDPLYRGALSNEKTALIVVDMINAYLEKGSSLYCDKCRQIIPAINRVAKFCRSNEIPVIFSNTTLNDAREPIAKRWGMHAMAGTADCEVVVGIETRDSDIVVPKTAYNAFFSTDLDSILRNRGVERLIVVGIHTHVCVLLTAAAAADLGYDVVVLEDCMTTGYEPNHQSRLRFFSTHVGKLMTSADLQKSLSKAAR